VANARPDISGGVDACRAEAWRAGMDRLWSMFPQGRDTLVEELARLDNRVRCKIAWDNFRRA
jgi:hypothetical protein